MPLSPPVIVIFHNAARKALHLCLFHPFVFFVVAPEKTDIPLAFYTTVRRFLNGR